MSTRFAAVLLVLLILADLAAAIVAARIESTGLGLLTIFLGAALITRLLDLIDDQIKGG